MKTYFVLLAILYVGNLANSFVGLAFVAAPVMIAKIAADVALMSISLWGCYGMAFGKRYLSAAKWRIVYQATLALGVATVLLYANGEVVGLPPLEGIGLLHAGMIFLPYVLFAVPIILYEKELKEKTNA